MKGLLLRVKLLHGTFSSDFKLVSEQNGDGYSSIDSISRKSGTLRYKNGGDVFNIKVTSGTINLNKL